MDAGGPAAPSVGAVPAGSGRMGVLGRELSIAFRIFRSNPLSLAGFVIVAVIALLTILVLVAPTLVLPDPPNQPGPTYFAGPSWSHPLGTDELGQDMFSRVVSALPLDLGLGVGIAGFAFLTGGVLGLISGYWDAPGTIGGLASAVILRLTDIFLAFPTLILALAIVQILHGGLTAAVIALLATWWPFYTRVARGEVLAIKARPYVTAARAAGLPERRILTRHVVRNLLEPMLVYYTLDIGTVIVTFSTIVYAGIGFPLTMLEWGRMVQYYGSQFLPNYPWPTIAPGLMVFVTVLGFSLLGDGLRDLLDPRSRRVLGGAGGGASPVAPGNGGGGSLP